MMTECPHAAEDSHLKEGANQGEASEDAILQAPDSPQQPPAEAEVALAVPDEVDEGRADGEYLPEGDALHRHLKRQSELIRQAMLAGAETEEERERRAFDYRLLAQAFESNIFGPVVDTRRLKKQENGCLAHDPRLNFYPCFMVPETLAAYHIFFQNQLIPLSCRANRPKADEELMLGQGDSLPGEVTLEEVPRIFDGLGDEVQPLEVKSLSMGEGEESKEEEEESQGALVELQGDNPRLAVVKRQLVVTHAAYPALFLPPKVMQTLMEQLIMSKAKPLDPEQSPDNEEDKSGCEPVVDDGELARWLGLKDETPESLEQKLGDRRRLMHSVALVSVTTASLRRFFGRRDVIKRLGESIHYLFKQGYVRQACDVSGVDLTNIVTYMGLMHENRVGQSVLHQTLKGEARRDYVRDTIYLLLVYTWQTAMGAWQQCLDESNLKELEKILKRRRRDLWTGFDERTVAQELSEIVFPQRLVDALSAGLPDLLNQSLLHNFRSFILERSGVLPAAVNLLPSDLVPISFKESPPTLWCHVYLLRLANYLMYHNDVAVDSSGPGQLLACHCRCNLCSPHRSLALNTPLLNEIQCIGTFELQGQPGEDGKPSGPGLKLTPALWTNAYLRKFEDADYEHDTISYFEEKPAPHQRPKAELSACVITAPAIVAQLQAISQARKEFLVKKGSGVYLDPKTGEELGSGTTTAPSQSRRSLLPQQQHAHTSGESSSWQQGAPRGPESSQGALAASIGSGGVRLHQQLRERGGTGRAARRGDSVRMHRSKRLSQRGRGGGGAAAGGGACGGGADRTCCSSSGCSRGC